MQSHPNSIVKDILQKNPTLLQSYVNWGTILVSSVLNPLGSILLHLLDVQGLDPTFSPIQRYRIELEEALARVHDSRDFDADYDLSWVSKKWQETNRGLKDFSLTPQKFRELTDISSVDDRKLVPAEIIVGAPLVDDEDEFFLRCTEINRVAPPAPKKEIPLTPEESSARDEHRREFIERLKTKLDLSSKYGRQKFRELVAEESYLKDITKFDSGGFAQDKLRELEELLEKMEKPPSKSTKKTNRVNRVNRVSGPIVIKKEPATRLSNAPLSAKFNGSFRRAPSKGK